MNNQVYQAIINTINSDTNLTRDEIYAKVNVQLKTNAEYMKHIKENKNQHQIDQLKLASFIDSDFDDEIAPLKYQTFVSIYSNLKRRKMFKTSQWRKLKENSLEFSNRYRELQTKKEIEPIKLKRSACDLMNNNLILSMANELSIPPFLMARLILEGLIKANNIEMIDSDDNLDKKKDKLTVSQIIKELHLLKDERMSSEIIECCAIDDDYGPLIDSIKNLSGLKYENILETILNQKNISFTKESELREKGFDKTPDFKLEVPIALKNGVIISWIDSKCSFGDELTHAEYYETQFKFYLNRFGSGLVIYWLGFVKEIETSFTSMSDRSVIVSDHFPSDFKIFDLSSLTNDF